MPLVFFLPLGSNACKKFLGLKKVIDEYDALFKLK